jgi:hypothetical protein
LVDAADIQFSRIAPVEELHDQSIHAIDMAYPERAMCGLRNDDVPAVRKIARDFLTISLRAACGVFSCGIESPFD